MNGIAWAQSGAPAGPSLLASLFPLLLIFIVFYFLLIRPQQQKQREHQKMLASLKVNDEVVTNGGLIGRIVQVSDRVLTLEVAPNVRVRVERSYVAGLVRANTPEKAKDKGKEKDGQK
ncbi:MAG: preprotein translocase subunit YajC [Candidatus Binatia bacterium]|nr:preprotein translocase subunit YajC [Candidatus Binatia bacterium]